MSTRKSKQPPPFIGYVVVRTDKEGYKTVVARTSRFNWSTHDIIEQQDQAEQLLEAMNMRFPGENYSIHMVGAEI